VSLELSSLCVLAEPLYGFKTLVEEGTGRILGAHLVGPGAEEVINLFGLAIRHDLTAEALKSTIRLPDRSIGYQLYAVTLPGRTRTEVRNLSACRPERWIGRLGWPR